MIDPICLIVETNVMFELEGILRSWDWRFKTTQENLEKIENAQGVDKQVHANPYASKKCKNKFSKEDSKIVFFEFWSSGDLIGQKIIF